MYQIEEGIHFIPGQDEFIPDAHVYVIGKPSSGDLSLIDAGLAGKGDHKIQSLRSAKIDLKSIKRVVMTHTHFDHIGCLSEIMKQIPGVELWVHTLEAEPLERGDDRTVYGMDVFRSMCQMQYGFKPGAFKFQVRRKLQDSESLDIGGMTWEVLHIPGHSMGSIALYHRQKKILIPGDVVYANHAIGRFDLHGANASHLKNSLQRLAKLEVDVLLPGHNEVIEKVPKGYIQETLKQWEPYLT